MSQLMKVSEVSETMGSLSREMVKAGLIEEQISEAMDSALGDEDLETEANLEVDKIMREVVEGTLAPIGAVPQAKIETSQQKDKAQADIDREAERLQEEKKTQELLSRLEGL